ncbi:MAG: GGDEF domain-containing protein [Burkholderiales bacterium]|nr:GGDEF domain-containing protein [Burkholderiales bacterium]
MTRTKSTAPRKLHRALALEFYERLRRSTLFGILSILIVVMFHLATVSPVLLWSWVAGFTALMALRTWRAHRMVRLKPTSIEQQLRVDGLLTLVSALFWGTALLLFGSGQVDTLFFIRLIIIAAAGAFVLASLSVYLWLYVGYIAVIWLHLAYVSMQLHDSTLKFGILLGMLVYFVMLTGNGWHLGRLARKQVIGEQKAQSLAALLASKLAHERELLATQRQLTSQLQRANNELEHLAYHDVLTGLMNRRASLIVLDKDVTRSNRYGHALTIGIMDIDHFKRINDQWGHTVGDAVLHQAARRLCMALRGTDLMGRIGGEEFLLIFDSTGLRGARDVAERLRGIMADMPFMIGDEAITVTISMGLACHRSEESVESLIARADDALYEAKSAGRNQICTAS